MKRSIAIVGVALTLLFGAAFKCASSNNRTPERGPNNPTTTTTTAGGLKLGEYACTGADGNIMIGLGFKVVSGNRYTDLDNKERGTYSISDDTITFRGGHLDGQVGTNLKDNRFNIHSASCGPF